MFLNNYVKTNKQKIESNRLWNLGGNVSPSGQKA